ncbi:MAG: VOC family protein [Bacteroidetes bacterium]|nr:VOC family protein [Bacteroidota bacterium]
MRLRRTNLLGTSEKEIVEKQFPFFLIGLQSGCGGRICSQFKIGSFQELAVDSKLIYQTTTFSGLTISHNTLSEKEVDEVLEKGAAFGATIVKPAQKVYWGGYSDYFKDTDGYLFEVDYNPIWEIDEEGNVKL